MPRNDVINLQALDDKHLQLASNLCVRAKAHWGYDPEFMALCKPGVQLKQADLETSEVVGAYNAETLVGVAQLVPGDDAFLLDKLFVEPHWIGFGIGRQLFLWCVEKARQSGGQKIVIESDPFAEPIYLAFGCRKVGEAWSESTGRSLPLLEYHLLDQDPR
jgi:predicted GNAT family N-acyltransferase